MTDAPCCPCGDAVSCQRRQCRCVRCNCPLCGRRRSRTSSLSRRLASVWTNTDTRVNAFEDGRNRVFNRVFTGILPTSASNIQFSSSRLCRFSENTRRQPNLFSPFTIPDPVPNLQRRNELVQSFPPHSSVAYVYNDATPSTVSVWRPQHRNSPNLLLSLDSERLNVFRIPRQLNTYSEIRAFHGFEGYTRWYPNVSFPITIPDLVMNREILNELAQPVRRSHSARYPSNNATPSRVSLWRPQHQSSRDYRLSLDHDAFDLSRVGGQLNSSFQIPEFALSPFRRYRPRPQHATLRIYANVDWLTFSENPEIPIYQIYLLRAAIESEAMLRDWVFSFDSWQL